MICVVMNMKHDNAEMIGIKIKELRKSKGMTQDELAKQLREKHGLKTTRPMVGKWEIGYQTPEMYTIKCIANILGVTIDYLADSTPNKKQPTQKGEPGEDMVVVHRNGKRLVYHITDNNLDSILPLLETLEAKSDPDL